MQKREFLEKAIVNLILLNVDNSIEATNLLKLEYFNNETFRFIVSCSKKLAESGLDSDYSNIVNATMLTDVQFFTALHNEDKIFEILLQKHRLLEYVEQLEKLHNTQKFYNAVAISKKRIEDNEQDEIEAYSCITKVVDEISTKTQDKSAIECFSELYDLDIVHNTQKILLCGIPAIDYAFKEMRGGRNLVVGARTHMGKSTFCIQTAAHHIQNNTKVVYISLEMVAHELVSKILSNYYAIKVTDILNRKKHALDDLSAKFEFDPLHLENLVINDKASNLTDIETIIRKHSKQKNTVFIVDHLGLIETENSYDTKEYLKLSEITRKFHKLTRELDIGIISVCQINREGANKMPSLSNLAGSSDIERNADGVIILHQENAEETDKTKPIVLSVNIAKNRCGRTQLLENIVKFNGEHQVFKQVY